MNYDIAVGPCVALLRVPLALCSKNRPPQPGQEVYLDFSRVEAGTEASVDPGGDGHYETVDIRQLLQNLNPLTTPVMTPKPRAAHWPIKPGR